MLFPLNSLIYNSKLKSLKNNKYKPNNNLKYKSTKLNNHGLHLGIPSLLNNNLKHILTNSKYLQYKKKKIKIGSHD